MDHNTGHDHDHDHGGGHDHHHHHDHQSDENLEQLLTVGISLAFGVVAIIMAEQAISTGTGMLTIMKLPKPFWYWVLAGGITLTLLAFVRGIALWKATGAHVHGEDCGTACGHDHAPGEAHEHGGIFWRVVVLMFPLVLFFLGLPNAGFSQEFLQKRVTTVDIDVNNLKTYAAKGDVALNFDDISNAMRDTQQMEALNGSRATVRGQLKPESEKQFTLFTMKYTCCASDMVPLKAKIVLENDDSGGSLSAKGYKPGDWLEVKGVLQFVPVPNSKQWLPVITAKLKDTVPTAPE